MRQDNRILPPALDGPRYHGIVGNDNGHSHWYQRYDTAADIGQQHNLD